MEIKIQEHPLPQAGDLIFVEDMVSGRCFQVIKMDDCTSFGLYDTRHYGVYKTFPTLAELQGYVSGLAHTIKPSKQYYWQLMRKQ